MAVNWSSMKTAAEAIGIGGTLLVALLTLWTNRQSQVDIQQIQQHQSEATHSLEQIKHLNDYSLHVYKEVVDALKQRDERLERVATALVEAMPADSSLRASLLQAITVGARSEEAKEEAAFAAEQPVPRALAKSEGGRWDIDIFYCEGVWDGQRRAEAFARELRGKPLGEASRVGRVRARKLPEVVNSRAGYQVEGIQIRHEGSESEAGRALQEAIRSRVTQLYGGRAEIQLVQSTQSTPGYLSLFLCPARAGGS
jgi:hypothetical protein